MRPHYDTAVTLPMEILLHEVQQRYWLIGKDSVMLLNLPRLHFLFPPRRWLWKKLLVRCLGKSSWWLFRQEVLLEILAIVPFGIPYVVSVEKSVLGFGRIFTEGILSGSPPNPFVDPAGNIFSRFCQVLSLKIPPWIPIGHSSRTSLLRISPEVSSENFARNSFLG